jgi:hypothetical protein
MATYDQRSGANDRGLVASDNNYSNVVNATTANEGVEASGDDFASAEFFTPIYYNRRNVMEFDLTSIPAGSTITAGTLKITTIGTTGDTNNYSVNVFYFSRASTPGTAFVANDFDEARGTAACDTPIDITGISGVKTFTLNAAALTYLGTKAGGYAQFSGMLSGDYTPSTPTGANLLDAYKGTDGTVGNRPRLELTYTPPTTSNVSSFYFM